MFLQRFIKKKTWCSTGYHWNICFHWWCVLLIILIIFWLTLLCIGWIQGLNTGCTDPLWIFHVYKRVSFTLALRYLIVCPPPHVLKLKQEKPKFKAAVREFIIAHPFYSLVNIYLPVKSPFLFIINYVTNNNNKW